MIESVIAVQHVSLTSGVRRVWRIGKASHCAISSILRHLCERITVDDDNGISHFMHSADIRYDFLAAKVGCNLWVQREIESPPIATSGVDQIPERTLFISYQVFDVRPCTLKSRIFIRETGVVQHRLKNACHFFVFFHEHELLDDPGVKQRQTNNATSGERFDECLTLVRAEKLGGMREKPPLASGVRKHVYWKNG